QVPRQRAALEPARLRRRVRVQGGAEDGAVERVRGVVRRLAALLAIAALPSAARGDAAAKEQLDYFAGNWTCSGKLPLADRAFEYVASITYAWDLDGAWLASSYVVAPNARMTRGL